MRTIYRLPSGTIIMPDILDKLIRNFGNEKARRQKLFEYYEGKHSILDRTFADSTKPNNRVVSPFAHNITDFATGYFMGNPIKYDEVIPAVDEIVKYNDDPSVNADIAKNCSICGYGYELMYVDKYGELRYVSIDPTTAFMVYDNTIDTEPLAFIRNYEQYDVIRDRPIAFAEIYDKLTFRKYSKISGVWELIEERANNLVEVPATEYLNNPEGIGDFETCISLIDAYDTMISNSVNDSTEFSDAYLVLKGAAIDNEADDEGITDVDRMKKNRVICIDNDADAAWLTKDINSSFSENMKTRLSDSIHKFSNVPDMTDASFAANASGVAMKYKLLGLEDITAKKESEFRKGLVRRLEIMAAYLSLIGLAFDWRNAVCVFTRNLPINVEESANAIVKIGHLLSRETQLSMLPLDIDVEAEMEKVKNEKLEGFDDGFSMMP